MKCFLFFLTLFAASFEAVSQSIDSVQITSNSTPPSFYIEGTFPHTGFELSRIDYSANYDTVNINIFFKECGGFTAITKFDSLITFDQAFPVVPNYFRVKSFRDSNMVDTSCVQRVKPILSDSLVIFQNTFNLENRNLRNQFIKLYPNPVNNQLTIEIQELQLNQLEVEIKDISGKLVWAGKWIRNNNTVIKKINLKQLPPGEYILSISDGRNFYESSAFQKK